ncbi:hypothetical protein [Rhizobium sp. 11_C7_N12_5]|uniref:hypothetical protein n=1 Tax=Rhizobium sp. 11_C7_N12_5 TaxID=3240770 RepID=UPI003F1F17A4
MTPEQRQEHTRLGNNARKRKQRRKEEENKVQEPLSPELEEFADELLKLRLSAAIEALAEWQAINRKQFPALPVPPRAEDETWASFHAREERGRKFVLIRLMATDHVSRVGARRRKKRFEENEATEATRLGITVDAYRKRKKQKKLADQMATIVAQRAAG